MTGLRLRVPPLVQFIVAAVTMSLASRLFSGLDFFLPFAKELGVAFALLGLSIALGGVASFRRAGTTVNPLSPEDASSLVVSGIYHYTRNPMYLGMLVALLGWWCYLHNLAATPMLPFFVYCMNRLQIEPEEEILREKFPEQYSAYMEDVGRWINF